MFRHVRFIHESTRGPMHSYRNLIKQGRLKTDPFQEKTIQLLQDLHEKLVIHPEPPIIKLVHQIKDVREIQRNSNQITSPDFAWIQKEKTFFGKVGEWVYKRRTAKSVNLFQNGLKGLYMYGSVGTGKTMLMDLFYNSFPIQRKKRIHFHAFMQDIHKKVHLLRVKNKITSDPIPLIASELANNAWLLCFDEFQVIDITDAMILRRLFTELFNKGVIMVTTSNRSPDELYSNGIQRSSFLPTIELLKQNCNVHCLDGRMDYRQQEREKSQVYFITSDRTNLIISKMFKCLADGKQVSEKKIAVWGRDLVIKEYVNGVGKSSFQDLCGSAHSAADYLALASNLKILILTDIPKMQLKHRNEARRFITLIDALYENKIKLVLSASTSVIDLLSGEIIPELDDSQRLLMDDLKLSQHSTSLFTGAEELFAFERAISRLVEMQSTEWIGSELQEIISQSTNTV